MTAHLSAGLLRASSTLLPLAVFVVVSLTGLTLRPPERSALTYRAIVAVALAVGLASLVGRLPLEPSTYAALAAALLVPLRGPLGTGLLLVAAFGDLASGDLAVHQRPVVLAGFLVGVLAAAVGTLVWQLLDPLPAPDVVRPSTAGQPGWVQLFAPAPVDLDHLDAIIDVDRRPRTPPTPRAPDTRVGCREESTAPLSGYRTSKRSKRDNRGHPWPGS